MPGNNIEGGEIAATILTSVGSLARLVSPFVSGGAAVAVQGLGGLADLAARLVKHGIHPSEAIAVWGSAIPDVTAANSRIDALIRERSAQ